MPLSGTTIELLKNLKAWQEKQKEFFGDEWNEADRLFTAVNGTPIRPDTV